MRSFPGSVKGNSARMTELGNPLYAIFCWFIQLQSLSRLETEVGTTIRRRVGNAVRTSA